ncbi:IS630 family transposase [Paraburkholderia kirstenboschensis]|uniref:IS630 family transposase n=1 Tax=Paraburkholderia kirstenboschensis TaxID=1245436 RepID=A0ABZ0EIK0_9BURK|nr:IS630 family transposase [Paraburkholderia kirstenboschensis]WOD17021.1 IS630 family transposase [Paraburkholderia kirstenboschensis]
MYSDIREWSRVRRRVLRGGESIRHVASTEKISRNTVRKMVRLEVPPGYRRTDGVGPVVQRPIPIPWHAVQKVVRSLSERDAARYLCSVFNREFGQCAPNVEILRACELGVATAHRAAAERRTERWLKWVYQVDQRVDTLDGDIGLEQRSHLLRMLEPESKSQRNKSLVVLANNAGFSAHAIATHLAISRASVRKYLSAYKAGGLDALFARKARSRLQDNENLRKAVFGLLHEPPSQSGINRTSWKLADLRGVLADRGHDVSIDAIRGIIHSGGYRWKSAKVVLTSTDGQYREKLEHIKTVLSQLKPDERFFSIDEFGPFSVKTKPGRILVAPDAQPSVPQWQKSKGCLICTAALELSRNQITHFYSSAKNTDEMICMAKTLLAEYKDARKLYLSWDAASWHLSKKLSSFISEHNAAADLSREPLLELAPLPASAQFLNVVESVFSGMARAIIHNSDYATADAAKSAIDRYFAERNLHFMNYPKRAGNSIWRMERTSSEFSEANNCKDAAYR